MSISPSATALCNRRMVPLRSASETRNATMSPPDVSPTLATYRSGEVVPRQRFEHHLGHPDRVFRAAAPDDQRRERQVAAIPGEPGVRSARELGLTGLR